MENIELYLSLLQWGVFFLFVLLNLLIGLKRGTRKTLYYTLVSFGLTIVLLFGISFVSVKVFFPTIEKVVLFAEKFIEIPLNVKTYILDPTISPVVYMLVDIVFKLIIFIILYIPIKYLLTITIFKPIYNRIINKKKKRLNVPSRLGGATIGAFRGVFVAIMFLLPVIVISGTVNNFDNKVNPYKTNSSEIETSVEQEVEEELELDDNYEFYYIIKNFNREGVGNIVKDLKLTKTSRSFDEFLFDLLFTSRVKNKAGETEKIRLSEELNSYGKIIQILIEQGYLDKGFDIDSINLEDNYFEIEAILNALSDTKLANLLLPYAVDILNNEGLIEKQLGFNPKENEFTRSAYNSLGTYNLSKDIKVINNIVKALLEIGSVGEIKELIKKPEQLLELTQDNKQVFANMVLELSDLELLSISNIFIEYLINNEAFLKNFDWQEDVDAYIHEELGYIFDDVNFFKGEINVLGNILLNVFKDEYKNFDYSTFIKNKKLDIDTVLSDDGSKIISEIIKGVSNLKLVTNSIPMAVDSLVFKSKNDLINSVADEISELVREQNFNNEINNIDSIYQLIVTLGVNELFKSDQNKIDVIDELLKTDGNFETVKQIINKLFVDSKAVNDVLEITKEPLIDAFIKNDDLKDVAYKTVNTEGFKIGQEIVNLISFGQDLYAITDIKTVTNAIKNKQYVDLINTFGNLTTEDFEQLMSNVTKLQTVEIAYKEIALFGINKAPKLNLTVPTNYEYKDFKIDYTFLLNFAHEFLKAITSLEATEANYKTLNIADGLDYDSLAKTLNFKLETHKNTLVLSNMPNLVDKYLKIDLNDDLSGEINEHWVLEINAIFKGLIDVFKTFENDNIKPLSINYVLSIKGINNAPLENLLKLSDDSINNLTSSFILRKYIDKTLNSEMVSNTLSSALSNMVGKEVVISTKPELDQLDEYGIISQEELLNIFKSLKLIDFKNISLKTLTDLNNDNDDLDKFLNSNYLRTIFSRLLTHEEVLNLIAESSRFNQVDFDLFYAERDLFDNLSKNEVKKIVIALDVLNLTDLGTINNETLKNLSDEDLSQVLESNYFYQVIDLTLKAQLADNITDDALDKTDYIGYIKKTEIKALIKLLKILDINDSSDINVNNITVLKLEQIINLNSNIINKLISKEIIEKEIVDVPEESINNGVINQGELENLINALKVLLEDDKPISEVDMKEVTITTLLLDDLLAINSGDSRIIRRMLSEATIKVFEQNMVVLDTLLENNDKDIIKDELFKISKNLKELGIEKISSDIDANNITVDNLLLVTNDGSVLINRLISESVETILGSDVENAKEGTYIKVSELTKLFEAIRALEINDIDTLNVTDYINMELVLIKAANNTESIIVRRIISKAIIAQNNTLVVSDDVLDSPKDIKDIELTNFINTTLNIDGVNDINGLLTLLQDAASPADLLVIIDAYDEDNPSQILEDTVTSWFIP